MSDVSDDMAFKAAEFGAHLERLDNDASKKIWTTRDGRRLKISNMEDSHLLNTIRFMISAGEDDFSYPVWFYAAQLRNLKEEAEKRKLPF